MKRFIKVEGKWIDTYTVAKELDIDFVVDNDKIVWRCFLDDGVEERCGPLQGESDVIGEIKKFIRLEDGRVLRVCDEPHQPDNVCAYIDYPYFEVFSMEDIVETADTREELE